MSWLVKGAMGLGKGAIGEAGNRIFDEMFNKATEDPKKLGDVAKQLFGEDHVSKAGLDVETVKSKFMEATGMPDPSTFTGGKTPEDMTAAMEALNGPTDGAFSGFNPNKDKPTSPDLNNITEHNTEIENAKGLMNQYIQESDMFSQEQLAQLQQQTQQDVDAEMVAGQSNTQSTMADGNSVVKDAQTNADSMTKKMEADMVAREKSMEEGLTHNIGDITKSIKVEKDSITGVLTGKKDAFETLFNDIFDDIQKSLMSSQEETKKSIESGVAAQSGVEPTQGP